MQFVITGDGVVITQLNSTSDSILAMAEPKSQRMRQLFQ